MTDLNDKEKRARDRLDNVLNVFAEEVRDVIQRKVHDSIGVSEVLAADDKEVKRLVLAWVQRIMIETIAEDLGEDCVIQMFDSAYFQICSQHVGPEDFRDIARPYRK